MLTIQHWHLECSRIDQPRATSTNCAAGHVGVPLHPPARLPAGETQLDLQTVRPQRGRSHHQAGDGGRGGGCVRAPGHRVRGAGETQHKYWDMEMSGVSERCGSDSVMLTGPAELLSQSLLPSRQQGKCQHWNSRYLFLLAGQGKYLPSHVTLPINKDS